ncbi:peptidase [Scytonema sp. UIC 10036]|uniref:C2 family cysteine protease n=1 Tax=Scytonema sp. UIC 10036 TaxID=2304196 RepID=UPI0012DA09AD|nr:C2 family cysteine protease [Scytonema sp. UIC 10036]MUG94399.1 peptidase [Scytonema sp. UIC 10036]
MVFTSQEFDTTNLFIGNGTGELNSLNAVSLNSNTLSGLNTQLAPGNTTLLDSSLFKIDPLFPSEIVAFVGDPGNTIASARNIGTLNGTKTYNNSVGNTDTYDYFRLNLNTANSSLNVSLTGMTADADVDVLNHGGAIIASSTRGGAVDDSINLSALAAGDYYVRVRQYSGNTNYSLKLSNAQPNNLLTKDIDIETLNGTRTYSDSVGHNDTSDMYRFSLSSAASGFNVTLTGLGADADVRLVRDANNNGIVDAGEEISRSNNGSSHSEWIQASLAAGNYFVQVYQYSGNSNYDLSISTGDWYSSNLSDGGLIGEARFATADGHISRNEMISILRETKDYGSIDTNELTSLRKLLSGAGYMMPEYVRNLSNKVINSDPANPRSGIGNLYVGSSDTQMEKLIGKWFLGNDRPTASGTYNYASGSLFQNGISHTDVDQGIANNCYFLASLGVVALRTPTAISNMFTDNNDGTFTVRFFNNGVTDYVIVDRYLPTTSSGYFVYANEASGLTYNSSSNELWVALAEKAYAQINESGWIGQDNTNSYSGTDFGWPFNAIRQITGRNTDHNNVSTLSSIVNTWNAGQLVVLNSKVSTTNGVVENHSYVMTGYNSLTQNFTLYNPHGGFGSTITLSWNQVLNNFDTWDRTTA